MPSTWRTSCPTRIWWRLFVRTRATWRSSCSRCTRWSWLWISFTSFRSIPVHFSRCTASTATSTFQLHKITLSETDCRIDKSSSSSSSCGLSLNGRFHERTPCRRLGCRKHWDASGSLPGKRRQVGWLKTNYKYGSVAQNYTLRNRLHSRQLIVIVKTHLFDWDWQRGWGLFRMRSTTLRIIIIIIIIVWLVLKWTLLFPRANSVQKAGS